MLLLTLLTIFTLIFTAAKDPHIRRSKFFTLLVVALFCLYLYYIEAKSPQMIFIVSLFILDEWLSIFPKIDKWNKMKLLPNLTYELVEFDVIHHTSLNASFQMTNDVTGNLLEKTESSLVFLFKSAKKTKTPFYVKDFASDFKVLKGTLVIYTKDIYGNITQNTYKKGERAFVSSYVQHSLESVTNITHIQFIASKR